MIEKVVYVRGMADKLPRNLAKMKGAERSVWVAPAMPQRLLDSIEREGILDMPEIIGNPAVGDPIEVDHIEIVADGTRKRVTVFNRGIFLFKTDSEMVKAVHRFCCLMAEESR